MGCSLLCPPPTFALGALQSHLLWMVASALANAEAVASAVACATARDSATAVPPASTVRDRQRATIMLSL